MNTRKKKENREATMFLKRCVLLVSYEEEPQDLVGLWARSCYMAREDEKTKRKKKKKRLREKEKYTLL